MAGKVLGSTPGRGKRFVSPKVQTDPRVQLILYLVGVGGSSPPLPRCKVPRFKMSGVTRPSAISPFTVFSPMSKHIDRNSMGSILNLGLQIRTTR